MSENDGYDGDDEQVIEFTPEANFDIRRAAPKIAQMMIDEGLPVIMYLPHVSVEFEPGCTAEEVIEGYTQAINHKANIAHSNSNDADSKDPEK